MRHVPVPVLPSEAEVEAHSVSHLAFRSWCSACVRGRGHSFGHRRVDAKAKEAEQIPTISVNYGFFGQPEERAHDTLLVRTVRDRRSKGIWSHPVPSIVALCDEVKNGWHGEVVPSSPMGESKSNGEVERAVQSVHGLGGQSEPLWNPEVRCWPGRCSIVPIFFYSSTKVNLTTVTLPTCV